MSSRKEYFKNRAKDRIARGLCRKCSKPQKEGKTSCEDCLKNLNMYAKNRAKDHIARGLCKICSKPRKEDKASCEDCLKRWNEFQKVRRNERIRNGLCVRCGRMKDVETTLCGNCKEKSHKSRDENCSRCGGPRDRQKDGRILRVCQKCIEYAKVRRVNRLYERRKAGLCERCGVQKNSSSSLCLECRTKRDASFRRRAKEEQERRRKLKEAGIYAISRQREWQLKHIEMGLCVYCSEKAEEGRQRCFRHYRSKR